MDDPHCTTPNNDPRQEVSRRAALVAESILFSSAGAHAQGPLPTAVRWDAWQPSWGANHFDSNPGGGICASDGGRGWVCGGIRVTFDRYAQPPATHPTALWSVQRIVIHCCIHMLVVVFLPHVVRRASCMWQH